MEPRLEYSISTFNDGTLAYHFAPASEQMPTGMIPLFIKLHSVAITFTYETHDRHVLHDFVHRPSSIIVLGRDTHPSASRPGVFYFLGPNGGKGLKGAMGRYSGL